MRLGFLALLLVAQSAFSAGSYVTFSFTNSVGQPDTNAFKLIPVSGPVANADGSFTTIGLPIKITPHSDGRSTNYLTANNYIATNQFLGDGIVFRVPDGDVTNSIYDLRISGFNTFVTVLINTNMGGGQDQSPWVADVNAASHSLTNAGTVSAASFAGNGGRLTNVTARELAGFASTNFGDITRLYPTNTSIQSIDFNASDLTISITNVSTTFFAPVVTASSVVGAFSGNGSAVTNINATNISAGTLPTGRLFVGTTNGNAGGYLLEAVAGERYRTYNGAQLTNVPLAGVSNLTNSIVAVSKTNVFLDINARANDANYWAWTNVAPDFAGQLGAEWNTADRSLSLFVGRSTTRGDWAQQGHFNASRWQFGDAMNMPLNTDPQAPFRIYANGNIADMTRIDPSSTNVADAVAIVCNYSPYHQSTISFSAVDWINQTNHSLGTYDLGWAKNSYMGLAGAYLGQSIGDDGLAGTFFFGNNTTHPVNINMFKPGQGQLQMVTWDSGIGIKNGRTTPWTYWNWSTNSGANSYTNPLVMHAMALDHAGGDLYLQHNAYVTNGIQVARNLSVGQVVNPSATAYSGLDVWTNASFNNDNSAWTFDSSQAQRLGFVKKASAYPSLVHGSGSPFTVSRSSAAALNTTAVTSQTLTPELTIDASGNATFAGTITGDASGMTNYNPANMGAGTFPSSAKIATNAMTNGYFLGNNGTDRVWTNNLQLGSGGTVVAGSFIGNASGMTNYWQRQILQWGTYPNSATAPSTKYLQLGQQAFVNSFPATQAGVGYCALPSTGYLSNFVAMAGGVVSSVSNIVVCVQTNLYTGTPADSGLLVTMTSQATNSGALFLNLTSNLISDVRVTFATNFAANLFIGGTVEWWHQ